MLIIGQIISYRAVNYWAEPATTPRNSDLAMVGRNKVYKEEEKFKKQKKMGQKHKEKWYRS